MFFDKWLTGADSSDAFFNLMTDALAELELDDVRSRKRSLKLADRARRETILATVVANLAKAALEKYDAIAVPLAKPGSGPYQRPGFRQLPVLIKTSIQWAS